MNGTRLTRLTWALRTTFGTSDIILWESVDKATVVLTAHGEIYSGIERIRKEASEGNVTMTLDELAAYAANVAGAVYPHSDSLRVPGYVPVALSRDGVLWVFEDPKNPGDPIATASTRRLFRHPDDDPDSMTD